MRAELLAESGRERPPATTSRGFNSDEREKLSLFLRLPLALSPSLPASPISPSKGRASQRAQWPHGGVMERVRGT